MTVQQTCKQYFLLTVDIKNWKVMINERNVFRSVRKKLFKNMITFDKLQLVKVMITQLVVY